MSGLILLASYPKSGNTWLRALLTSVLHGGVAVDINQLLVANSADRRIYGRTIGVNISDLTAREFGALRRGAFEFGARHFRDRRLLKVHDAWLPAAGDAYPIPESAIEAVVYVVRDPRDVASSFARHFGVTVEQAIQSMGNPRYRLSQKADGLRRQVPQLLSTWSVHVSSWLDGFEGRLHVLRYEDMVRDPYPSFRSATGFMRLPVTDQVLRRSIEATAFEVLKSQEVNNGFVERPPSSAGFFHGGRTNGWRDCLGQEQVERIVSEHGPIMRRMGYID